MGRHPIVLGRIADEPTPTTADIEQSLTWFQAQLTADHLQLVTLRRGEIILPVGEIGAGIDHFGSRKSA